MNMMQISAEIGWGPYKYWVSGHQKKMKSEPEKR